ncbi:transposase [Thermophilibacter provencensis]|uniref:Transposase n=1 Tax=Thermophilibacter provencensis TaxID=1852386 RepID=A0ABT7V4N8_9ACTN|nr:transposase [Thermophilibacter provencensis]MDM8271572.1 transposase [Thermophilibacter provencensis]
MDTLQQGAAPMALADMPMTAYGTIDFRRLVMGECLQQVVACEERRDRLDAAVAGLAAEPEWAPLVSRISAVRGIGTVTAFSIAAEVGDFSRFPSTPAFMSYLRLVPSEDSSGGRVSRGPITRTGNGHARTLMVEAAWHHARRRSPLSPTEIAKRSGIGPEAARVAAEAERLRRRGIQASKANVAVARELAGFVWALAVCEG